MIIVKMMGGLGGQMFIYATGRKLAHILNTELKMDCRLVINRELLPSNATFRKYEIGIFNINENIATEEDIKRIEEEYTEYPYFYNNRILRRLFSYLRDYLNIYLIQENSIIRENKLGGIINEINLSKIPNNVYLDGYWNHYTYFKDIEDILRKEFTFRNKLPDKLEPIENSINRSNSISLNVRRGDYVTNPTANEFMGVLPLNYFNKAVNYISRRVKKPVFFVFSDDIDWCRKQLSIEMEHYFIENDYGDQKFEYDIRLISSCKHNVIPNSGFSWWGAWLNNYSKKIVVTPQKWFKKDFLQKAYETKEFFIPSKWIKIPNHLK